MRDRVLPVSATLGLLVTYIPIFAHHGTGSAVIHWVTPETCGWPKTSTDPDPRWYRYAVGCWDGNSIVVVERL